MTVKQYRRPRLSALDHADGSLWFNVQGIMQNTFYQFSKNGDLLSSETYEGLSGFNILGGEFAVPAPSAFAAMVTAGLAAGRRRRR